AGLMPPPEPKMNLSNFMKVLANESIADPSAVTAKIQAQIREREKNHEMRNLARKLTPEERREKKRRKIINDMKKQIEVALFRVRQLHSPKIRYKIDVNAQQSGLSGAVLTCRDPAFGEEGMHLVVVEGGPRSVRRFVKLMTRRIKWRAQQEGGGGQEGEGEEEEEEEEEEEDGGEDLGERGGGICELVWRGVVAKPSFAGFKFQECRTLTTARKVFEGKGVAHYADMCFQNVDVGGGKEGEGGAEE
ncbi:u4 u6 small nuclear ribonucleoprotein prp3, partial [Nannochloropsis gaditana]